MLSTFTGMEPAGGSWMAAACQRRTTVPAMSISTVAISRSPWRRVPRELRRASPM
jgi:hypothetical protein